MKRKIAVLTGILALAVLLFGCFNQPNIAPVASFVCLTENPCAGEPTAFDASASFDEDGSIISYEWDFGDGSVAQRKRVARWYQSVGTFTVQLTVTDNHGAMNTCSLQVEVVPIVSELTVSIQNLDKLGNNYCTCHRILVSVKNVLGPCTIDWGDGRRDIGNSAEHHYKNPGLYNLVVIDSLGNEVYCKPIYIEACCFEPPVVYISIPRFVSIGSNYNVVAEDPDQLYTICNENIPRPMCQKCGTYQVPRGPANDAGICLIQASFYPMEGGTRKELVNVQKLDLDNPILWIPDLSSGWYEIELLVVDDDPDCENGRQTIATVPIKIE